MKIKLFSPYCQQVWKEALASEKELTNPSEYPIPMWKPLRFPVPPPQPGDYIKEAKERIQKELAEYQNRIPKRLNPKINFEAKCIEVDVNSIDDLFKIAQQLGITLTVTPTSTETKQLIINDAIEDENYYY